MFRSLPVILVFVFGLSLGAQEEVPLHTFTDKSGKQVHASLLSISEDRRTMKIRREDGQEFELVINVLSLDDQQFIQDQLGSLPVEAADYRIEMDVSRKAGDSESHPYSDSDSYELDREFLHYEITVKNLSREPVVDARLEWAIAWKDQVEVYQNEDMWVYRAHSEEDEPVGVNGEEPLSTLPYNQETVIVTASFELNEARYLDDAFEEDEALGMIARVVGRDGTVIEEVRMGDSDIERFSWDEVVALAAPRTRD